MSVTVYSTPSCPYCVMVKDFLKKKNVRFTDFDVSRDEAKAMEMIRKTGQMGVPVVDVGGKVFVGFQPGPIEQALKQAELVSA